MKSLIRRLSHETELFTRIRAFYSILRGRAADLGVSHLISYYEKDACGPLQREEALFLFSLIRMIRPKLVVEFGFMRGDSSYNFLRALAGSGRLVSFDISQEASIIANAEFKNVDNFQFLKKSQTDFSPNDINNEIIDFVFLDASHEIEHNKMTWAAIYPSLSETAIIAVHDTGTWHRSFFGHVQTQFAEKKEDRWITPDEFVHQPDERLFVNWIIESHPEFSPMHFHASRTLRHGLTLFQKSSTLPI